VRRNSADRHFAANDLICVGARLASLVDYMAVDRVDAAAPRLKAAVHRHTHPPAGGDRPDSHVFQLSLLCQGRGIGSVRGKPARAGGGTAPMSSVFELSGFAAEGRGAGLCRTGRPARSRSLDGVEDLCAVVAVMLYVVQRRVLH